MLTFEMAAHAVYKNISRIQWLGEKNDFDGTKNETKKLFYENIQY